ncbi:hydroxymethylglutaryl-CoA lyase [Promicromonospora sp. NPDC019610]|uniref:hydroxymethylglutaryl-CoA lyase n=1 Tax=Promicromonospora sp. NPDC019610 TaxID=3364405 RepID=UPI0037958E1E
MPEPMSGPAPREYRRPQVVRDPALPERVTVYEVGPRDGLQNEKAVVPTAVKVDLVERLLDAGLPYVEATSLVHPRWVPQLADAAEVLGALVDRLGDRARDLPVLVPNERGLERAYDLGLRHIAVFASATDSFARRNLNRSLDEQYAMFEPVMTRARAAGMRVRAYVSMCFGDPWEGDVPLEQVVTASRRLMDLGAEQLSLGDTIGVGTPGHVVALLDALNEAGLPDDVLALHAHDTYGQALGNVAAALRHGVTTFDTSAGGLGGCPYAESATGNLATEDLLWMLDGLGITTGVSLPRVVETSAWLEPNLDHELTSRTYRALGGGGA